MFYFSLYASKQLAHFFAQPSSFFAVVPALTDASRASIAQALGHGARAVVVEWKSDDRASRISCRDLAEGVPYFFVRSVPDTLARWSAVPVDR